MTSVWILHQDLPKVNHALDLYGADRADIELDLGLISPFNKHDALAAFLAWLPLTLADEDIAILEPLYTLSETSRSNATLREWIVFPLAITLILAETMISPVKV